MSQANVDVVRRMFEAFNRGDVDAVIATFDDGCVLEEPREMPDRPSLGFRGHDGHPRMDGESAWGRRGSLRAAELHNER